MNILHSIILGVVEGLTEFLPISSTFHLIFTSKLLGLPSTEFQKMFEVVIQSGAILAAIALYYKDVLKDRQLAIKVLIAFIPTAIIGLALYKVIKTVFFESTFYMMFAFVSMGIAFIAFESLVKKKRLSLTQGMEKLTYKQAVLIGIVQALAVVPGVSRAGAVMLGMMTLGFKRDEAARFSFMLAVPTIFAASALDIIQMRHLLMQQGNNLLFIGIGFFVSAIVAYIVMRWFVKYLQHHTLVPFAIYRFVLVIIILLAFGTML